VVAEHHPLASRYTVLSAHCLISVLCVTNVYNNKQNLHKHCTMQPLDTAFGGDREPDFRMTLPYNHP